jgi:hypothetical protein
MSHKRLWMTLLIGSLFGMNSIAVASAQSVEANFDLNQAFKGSVNPSHIAMLSQQEMQATQGAVAPIVAAVGAIAGRVAANVAVRAAAQAGGGAALGVGGHIWHNNRHDLPTTPEGVAYAAGVGAVGGAATGALVKAAGGGVAANVAWRPGTMGLGMGVQAANPANHPNVNNNNNQNQFQGMHNSNNPPPNGNVNNFFSNFPR